MMSFGFEQTGHEPDPGFVLLFEHMNHSGDQLFSRYRGVFIETREMPDQGLNGYLWEAGMIKHSECTA